MHAHNENINQEIETTNRTQTKIMLKNAIHELVNQKKDSSEGFGIKFDQAAENVSKLEERSFKSRGQRSKKRKE